mmetsp:Transcript_23885/g.57020  ORF Transcript_23885/g.57020 Transcript_23885/m.57020 type:complete len:235 (-) Transcript_23885:285-989(-)
MSSAITFSHSGRCTLIATASPDLRYPLYTCPIEAAATGVGSTFSKTSDIGSFSSSSMILKATSLGKGGRRSCSFCSSCRYSGGSRSGREERAWPALMKAGPREAMISMKSLARFLRFSFSTPRCQSTNTWPRKVVNGTEICMSRFHTSRVRSLKYCSASLGSYRLPIAADFAASCACSSSCMSRLLSRPTVADTRFSRPKVELPRTLLLTGKIFSFSSTSVERASSAVRPGALF